jgi:hypothetical protein
MQFHNQSRSGIENESLLPILLIPAREGIVSLMWDQFRGGDRWRGDIVESVAETSED